jgi:hypothetical protein
MDEINIGFVGYSNMNFDIEKAKSIIYDIFDVIENKYCNEENLETKINIISGATDIGIPSLVYNVADNENLKYGKWFTLVGIMAKEGYKYPLYPCDKIYAVGEHFGEESEFFLNKLNALYKIGGGKQSDKESELAKRKGIVVYEYSL